MIRKSMIKGVLGFIVLVLLTISAISYSTVSTGLVVSYSKEFQHADSPGGKGRDSLLLSAPSDALEECPLFEKAEIIYKKRRYGQAKIVTTPRQGCSPSTERCKVEIVWEHAPAGRLNYKVKAEWEKACVR